MLASPNIRSVKAYKKAAMGLALFIISDLAIAVSLFVLLLENYFETEWTASLVPLMLADLSSLLTLPAWLKHYRSPADLVNCLDRGVASVTRLLFEGVLTVYFVSPSFWLTHYSLVLSIPVFLSILCQQLYHGRVNFLVNGFRFLYKFIGGASAIWLSVNLDGLVKSSWLQRIAPVALLSAMFGLVPIGCVVVVPVLRQPAGYTVVNAWVIYVLLSVLCSVAALAYKSAAALRSVHFSIIVVMLNCLFIALSGVLLRNRLIYWLMGLKEAPPNFKLSAVSIPLSRRSPTYYQVQDTEEEQQQIVDDPTCNICFEAPSNAALLACLHGGLCFRCGLLIYVNDKKCHICKQEIDGMYALEVDEESGAVTAKQHLLRV